MGVGISAGGIPGLHGVPLSHRFGIVAFDVWLLGWDFAGGPTLRRAPQLFEELAGSLV